MKKVIVVCLALLMMFMLSVPSIEADAALAPGLACTVYITLNTGVASIGVCIGTTYDASSATIFTSSGEFSGIDGVTICWKATPKSGYTMSVTSSTYTPKALLLNEISPSATKTGGTTYYTLTVNVPTGVASVRVTYGSSSKTFNTSGTLSVTSGTSVSWTATAKPGYNLSSSSGSFTMTSAKTIAPTATVKSFTVRVSSYTPSDAYAAFSWTLEWAEGEELTGDPTDYVTMTVASDGMSVTLTFKKAFTAGTMILTCYATNNPSVSATCIITCG